MVRKQKCKSIISSSVAFYYKTRFFWLNPKIDGELVELLTDISLKLNPSKFQNRVPRSLLTQQLKKELDIQ